MRQNKQRSRSGDGQRLIRFSTPVIFPFPEPRCTGAELLCVVFSQESLRQELRQILDPCSETNATYDSKAATEAFRAEIMEIIEKATKD